MISVITPVYNGEKFIEFCLQTVIQQQCSEVEHIIVDGGSQDRTIEIVRQYAQQYLHIRWISEPDQGQSDAMNKGIQMAKGEIINFLNVDDYYEAGVLNQILERFKTLPEPSFVAGNCKILDESGNLLEMNRPSKLRLIDLVSGQSPFPCNPSAYFYHTSLHQQVGLYNLAEHYVMDLDFILRAVQVATVQYVDQTWGNFRFIRGTKTQTDKENGLMEDRIRQILRQYHRDLTRMQRLQLFVWRQWRRVYCLLTEPKHFMQLLQLKFTKQYSTS